MGNIDRGFRWHYLCTKIHVHLAIENSNNDTADDFFACIDQIKHTLDIPKIL